MKCDIGSFYYKQKCYFVSDTKLGWCDALSFCAKRNSKMLSIDNGFMFAYPIKLFKIVKSFNEKETYWVCDLNRKIHLQFSYKYFVISIQRSMVLKAVSTKNGKTVTALY